MMLPAHPWTSRHRTSVGRSGTADTWTTWFGMFVALLAFAGCSSDQSETRDAASEVQESVVAGHWALTDGDVMRTIGEEEGLLIAQAGEIVVLDDGTTIVQANGNEISLFSVSGGPVRTVGRQGSGPGEFMFTPRLFHFRDGIGAFDLVQSRVSLFDREGIHLQTIRPASGRISAVVGSPDASMIVGRMASPVAHIVHYARYSLDGEVIDTIGPIVGVESTRVQWVSPDGITRGFSHGCDPEIIATTVGSTLYIFDGGNGHLSAVSPDRSIHRIHEVQVRQIISQQLLDRVQSLFESREVPDQIAREALARFGAVGDSEPVAWDRVLPDQEGRIWLQRSECQRDLESPRIWEVVDVSGGYLGTVSIPSQYSLRAVHGNMALAYSFDEFGVASLNILRIPIPD